MPHLRPYRALLVLGLLLTPWFLHAQNYLYGTGSPTWGINLPIENGFLNVANGEIHLEIPVANHKQRGDLQLNERLVYDSRIWKIVQNGGSYSFQPTNVPNSMAGWRFTSGIETGTSTYDEYGQSNEVYGGCNVGGTYQYDFYESYLIYSSYQWTDPQGTVHTFPIQTEVPISVCDGDTSYDVPNGGGYAADGSGYSAQVTNNTTVMVFDIDGNEVYPNVVDRNGNFFSADANGNLVDTLGRTPVITTTNGNTIDYAVLTTGGAREHYTVVTEPVSVSTSFGQSAVNEYSGTLTAIKSITLPDGNAYTFTYDSGTSPIAQFCCYAEIQSMTLPTGSTVSFGWNSFADSYRNVNHWATYYSGGQNSYDIGPQVVNQCSGSNDTGCQEKMSVFTEAGEIDYLLTLNNGAWNTTMDYNTTGTPTHILSVATSNNFSTSCQWYGCAGSQWITASSVTTTLPDTGQVAQTAYTYTSPWLGKPSTIKTWDYNVQTNQTATKEIDYTYGCFGFPSQIQLYGPNSSGQRTLAAQTAFNYDEGTVSPTSGLPNHGSVPNSNQRCNVTSIIQGTTQSVTTHSAYDDAGTKLSDTDVAGNQIGYASSCSDAYQGLVSYPVIANGQHLRSNMGYDCLSGLVTSTQDFNGVATNHATSYTYYSSGSDIGKLQAITYPDGGSVSYTYPSATETDATVAQTATTSITTKTILDGFGRKAQAVQVAPEGSITSETTYDGYGKPATITNAHLQGTTSPTDGVTKPQYDLLERLAATQQPDGSWLFYTYTGSNEKVADQSGRSKQLTYDAYHRLVKVLEPDVNGALTVETDYQYNALDKLVRVDQWGGAYGASSPGDRVRLFSYDALGRLTLSQTPEQGSISYTYPWNGSACAGNPFVPCTKTDGRGETVRYTYDQINRILAKTFPNDPAGTSTPVACFQYDTSSVSGSGLNLIGNLTNQWTQHSSSGSCPASLPAVGSFITATEILNRDAAGRPTTQLQCSRSNCAGTQYSLAYNYDYAGELKSYTNGLSSTPGAGAAPLTFTQTFDTAGRLQTISSSWNDATHPPTLFSGQQGSSAPCPNSSTSVYSPPGGLMNAVFGSGSGSSYLTLNRAYDVRGRVTCEVDGAH